MPLSSLGSLHVSLLLFPEAGTVLVCHRGRWLLHQSPTGFEDGPVGQVSRGPGEREGLWCTRGAFEAGGARGCPEEMASSSVASGQPRPVRNISVDFWECGSVHSALVSPGINGTENMWPMTL